MDMQVRQRLDELAAPKRNHYFYGKLLDEMHLRMEQDYFYGKRALLNRLALGSGVLCGLVVQKDGKFVKVSAGVAIDGYGREIIVPQDVRIDTSKVSADCCTVRDRKPEETPLYLTLCYRECKTDFEPALVSDCQPRQQCAASTIVESYCFELGVDPPPDPPGHDDELCNALRDGADADEKRKLVNIELDKPCGGVAGNGCIALAKIGLDQDGNITDPQVPFDPPARVYSNATLFDMLLCMGEGGKGDPGIGLDKDLPKILDIGWKHDGKYTLHATADVTTGGVTSKQNVPGTFVSGLYAGNDFATVDQLTGRLQTGDANSPLLTVYFNRVLQGIDVNTFVVKLKVEVLAAGTANNPVVRPGIYLEFPVVGSILAVAVPTGTTALTPNTGEPYLFAASFIPRQEFLAGLLNMALLLLMRFAYLAGGTDNSKDLAFASFGIELKGDFVTTGELDQKLAEHAVLDGNNIGGWVGTDHQRDPQFIGGGINPSGNLTQGGSFESWLRVAYGQVVAGGGGLGAEVSAAEMTRAAVMMRTAPESAPVDVNLATRDQLEAAGLTEAQANRVVEVRRTQWLAGSADLQHRVKLSGPRLRDLSDRLIVT